LGLVPADADPADLRPALTSGQEMTNPARGVIRKKLATLATLATFRHFGRPFQSRDDSERVTLAKS
jgi:hypothetical protein